MGPPKNVPKAPVAAQPQLVPSAAALREAEASNVDGNSAFKGGNDAEAIAYYTAAVVLSGGSVAKYFGNRAQARLRAGALEEARDDAAAAVRLEPASLKFNFRHAKALMQLGQLREAKDVLDRVIATDASAKGNPDVVALLATIANGGGAAAPAAAQQPSARDSTPAPAAAPAELPSRSPGAAVASLQDPSATAESIFSGQNLHPVFAVSPPGPLDQDTFWIGRPRVEAYTWLVDAYRVRTYNAHISVADDNRWTAVRLGRADPQTVEADFLAFVDSVRRRLPRGFPSWWNPLQLVRVARMDMVPLTLDAIEARSHMCTDSVACWPHAAEDYVDMRGKNTFCPVTAMRHIIVNLGGGKVTMHHFAPSTYTGATVHSPHDDAAAAVHRRTFQFHARCPEADDDIADEEEEELWDTADDYEEEEDDDEVEEEEGSWETEDGEDADGVIPGRDADGEDDNDGERASGSAPHPTVARSAPATVYHADAQVADADGDGDDDDDDDDMPPPLEDITGE